MTVVDEIGPDYAELDEPMWQEPQTYYKLDDQGNPVMPYNWCGPGATSGVSSRWRIMQQGWDPVPSWPAQGPYPMGEHAYQYHLAYDLGEVENLGDDDPWSDNTTFPGMISATNSAANASGFYMQSETLTFDLYKSHLWSDLHEARVPLIPVVNTEGLPGWAYGVPHWVAVKQFWFGGDTTTYGDSAGPIQGSGSTYGWHVWSLSDFYAHIQIQYNTIVW